MKRFVLFAGYTYYPRGGFNDKIGSFDTLNEAHEAVATYDWYQIYDSFERRLVAWN